MKQLLTFTLATLFALVLAVNASAFNGERSGFLLGFGIGTGSLSLEETGVDNSGYGGYYYGGYNDFYSIGQMSHSKSGLTTDFRIGGAPSDYVQIYYSSRTAMLSEGDFTALQGLGGLGVSYYIKPTAPSPYFTATYGLTTVVTLSGSIGDDLQLGTGYALGAGYEFARHFSVEATMVKGSYGSDVDGKISAFRLTVHAIAF